MSKSKLLLIGAAIVIFFAALGVYFTVSDNTNNDQTSQVNTDNNFGSEDVVEEKADPSYFESFGTSKLKVVTYGGPSDIKTALVGKTEYALIRNPTNTIDYTFYKSDSFGDYYFAEYVDGSRIEFPDGTPEGRFGYGDSGEVSQLSISDRNSSTEYYAAYPTQELATKYGFISFRDDAITNLFLKNKYLRIKNLNNNREVIVEIDSRNSIEDTLYVSEATRKALLIDEGALGSFSLEVVDKTNNTLGVVRL